MYVDSRTFFNRPNCVSAADPTCFSKHYMSVHNFFFLLLVHIRVGAFGGIFVSSEQGFLSTKSTLI